MQLKIKLFRGDFEQFETVIKICERTLQQDKNDIIIQKLDSLFNYKSAEESVAKFKELLEIYNENNMHYKFVKRLQ